MLTQTLRCLLFDVFSADASATADLHSSSCVSGLFFSLLRAAPRLILLLQQRSRRGRTAAVSSGEARAASGVCVCVCVCAGSEPEEPGPQTVCLETYSAVGTRPVYTSASRPCLRLAHIFVLPRLNSSDVCFAPLELRVSGPR